MKCPVDDAVLVMSERAGVEIDYCPTCRGVWLDRGELDKILDRAAREQPAAGPAGPAAGQSAPPAAPGGPVGAPGPGAPRYGGAFEEAPVPPPPPAPEPGYPPHQPYYRRGFFGSAPSAPSPEDYYRGGYGGRRRRRSWLDELFD